MLPTAGGGIEKVRDGQLTASAIYPTHGDDLMPLALAILRNEPFEKNVPMETSIVTAANASVLVMQHKEVVQQDEYIKKMQKRVDNILSELGTERILLFIIIFVVIIVCVFLVISLRMTRTKHLLSDSSLSIFEIAYRVGFSSPSYFTKCYRDFFGKAPMGVR